MAKTTTKKKVVSLKGRSEAWLSKESGKKAAIVEQDATQIAKLRTTMNNQKKIMDTADDFLKKTNGYNSQKEAYDAVATQLKAERAKLAKAKSKDKKSINAKIKSLQKQQTSIATTIKNISNSAEYKSQWNKRKAAKLKGEQAAQTLIAKQAKKAKDKDTAAKYKKALNDKKAAAHKKLVKKNSAAIQKKIKASKKAKGWNKGYTTAVYRADKKTSRVFLLGEVSPSESVEQNHVTHSVDAKDTRITHGNRSSKQLSGTYYLHGKSFREMDKLYNIFQGWQRKNIELEVRGFSRWNHAYISSIGKTMDAPLKNVLAIPITFDYEMRAHIKSAKKSKKKTKASASKKRGSTKSKKAYVTIKSGMTYWWISQKYGVSISWLEKNNKWPARAIPIGVKVRYK
ncbi:LysM peptidoglycan-binding domain-containing protein [Lactiplantibacillus daowaiensis]|uniref:LysM peptidoglycan-binding domain-containing protein n=1 Tax=Lactiplantibacillus daowaiensis TaxID=2559918 RepID=A0ABW1RXZ9_9LACO|nr:LysM peptidoglycan-binding domain-containing protein [Lactiplantibacillus daowaiensis]